MCFLGHCCNHRPLAQAVSQWSCTLLKPDLARAPRGSSLPEIVPRLRARSEPPAAGPGLGWPSLLQPLYLPGMGMCHGSMAAVLGAPRGCSCWGCGGVHSPTPCDCGCAWPQLWHCHCREQVAPGAGTGSCLLGPSPTSAQHHLAAWLGMEGWTGAIRATRPDGPHGAWLCSGTWSGMCRALSFAVRVFLVLCHAMSCCTMPCKAVQCHAVPCCAVPRCKRAEGCHRHLATGARPCSCGRGPSPCVGTSHTVLPRSSSARG